MLNENKDKVDKKCYQRMLKDFTFLAFVDGQSGELREHFSAGLRFLEKFNQRICEWERSINF